MRKYLNTDSNFMDYYLYYVYLYCCLYVSGDNNILGIFLLYTYLWLSSLCGIYDFRTLLAEWNDGYHVIGKCPNFWNFLYQIDTKRPCNHEFLLKMWVEVKNIFSLESFGHFKFLGKKSLIQKSSNKWHIL